MVTDSDIATQLAATASQLNALAVEVRAITGSIALMQKTVAELNEDLRGKAGIFVQLARFDDRLASQEALCRSVQQDKRDQARACADERRQQSKEDRRGRWMLLAAIIGGGGLSAIIIEIIKWLRGF